jgi:hypothetical protein
MSDPRFPGTPSRTPFAAHTLRERLESGETIDYDDPGLDACDECALDTLRRDGMVEEPGIGYRWEASEC